MSGESILFTRSWPVGRFTCMLTVPQIRPGEPASIVLEWSPYEPSALTKLQTQQYREGRNQAFADLAGEHGITIAVVDL